MRSDLKNRIPDWLATLVLKKAWAILAAAALLTAGLAAYSVSHFRIDTDFDALISSALSSQRSVTDLEVLFPQMKEGLVVVVDGKTPEEADAARDFLTDRFNARPDVFRSVFAPGGGSFYARNGLLYLDENALADLTDRLARVQPFLGMLSREISLPNLFATTSLVVSQSGDAGDFRQLNGLLGQMARTIEKAQAGQTDWISWQTLMSGAPEPSLNRAFILLWPYLDASGLNPARTAFAAIQEAKDALRAAGFADVSVGTTGELALTVANLTSAEKSIGIATAASFLLVAALLMAALQSVWLIFICLAVLVSAVIWTLGFAMAAIGRLNIMSATFIVLFIGLGIDFCIQYCLRYSELVRGGCGHEQAIRHTMREVGGALFLCTMTTAIGFYAFVPTAYVGASELGFISGTGMFILFAASMTVLPALLHVRPPSFKGGPPAANSLVRRITILPARFPKAVFALGLLACIGGAAAVPRIYFDFNPLNLNDTGSEAVLTAKKILKNPETSFWTMSVMTDSAQEAEDVARRLEKLPSVKEVLSIFDMLPRHQEEKIDRIRDMSLFLPQIADDPPVAPAPRDQTLTALRSLRRSISDASVLARFPAAGDLMRAIDRFLQASGQSNDIAPILQRMNTAMLLPLKRLLVQLRSLADPEPVTLNELPSQLIENYVSHGRYRVQVFPSDNLDNLAAMERFENAVRSVVPRATGAPVSIVGAGKAISGAFLQAFLTALSAIAVFLALVTRSARKISLILFPLVAGLATTIMTAVLLGIAFNFANIIVLPLLLGIGIDYPLHLVHRYGSDPSARRDILRTSTARGILFSALTTIASFSSLSFSSHRGMAGMGILLTLCITFMIAATLVLLPAVLYLFSNR